MNQGISVKDASFEYYDGDYPSQDHGPFPENFDETTKFQGLAFDVSRYKEIASEQGGPILELCCGTGRVAIPLAQEGFEVTGVDISENFLGQFRAKLERQDADLRRQITLVQQDICQLSIERKDFKLAVLAFNSLLCIPSFSDQIKALKSTFKHLAPGGMLVLDVVNPFKLKIDGDPNPKPFFTRKNPHTGNIYTRFAMMDAFDEQQRQRLYGWYDEVEPVGTVRRKCYSLYWRPIFRFELELMLKEAGCQIIKVEGGHLKESFTAQSPRMFVQAKKIA